MKEINLGQDNGVEELSTVSEYVSPTTELEHKLVRMWAGLLGAENIGVESNFFELGGSSVLMKEMLVLLNEQLQANLLIAELFRYPTIRDLATRLEGAPEQHADLDFVHAQGNRRREALMRRQLARR